MLRLCSVFEPDTAPGGAAWLAGRAVRFDPIGGMQNHTGALSAALDALGVRQLVVTSRLAARAGRTRRGLRTEVVRVGLPIPVLRQLWAPAALAPILRARHVDVVHAHQGEDVAVLVLARLAAAVHRCPLVVTVHCSVRHTLTGPGLRTRLLRRVGGPVERWALRAADAVVTLAERTARAVRDDGVRAGVVEVVPSGIDPALFAGRFAGRGASDAFTGLDRPRIGFVGRLSAQKRPDLLVRAFAAMTEKAELVIVGDGPMREEVERLVAASPAAARTRLLGFVGHDAVPGMLAALDVLALPSDYEELGSVLVEAMASGLPVVATAVGGIPEVVQDERTGLLVPPGDVAALAAALDRLAASAALRERLGEAARERSAGYAWPVLAGRILAVYQRVRPAR